MVLDGHVDPSRQCVEGGCTYDGITVGQLENHLWFSDLHVDGVEYCGLVLIDDTSLVPFPAVIVNGYCSACCLDMMWLRRV